MGDALISIGRLQEDGKLVLGDWNILDSVQLDIVKELLPD